MNLSPFWVFILVQILVADHPDWGFFAHRKINRYAVYTLPDPLFDFYKRHQSWVEAHAVDADKRRYAVRQEAICHFMDLDVHSMRKITEIRHLGKARFEQDHIELFHSDQKIAEKMGNSTSWTREGIPDSINTVIVRTLKVLFPDDTTFVIPVSEDSLLQVVWHPGFDKHGILPYRILQVYRSLEQAFYLRDLKSILRWSADLGHYIGDAHVPLHTTSNYNGQQTGQTGIHAFWESRLPELFLHSEHFLTIRPAVFISDPETAVWDVILQSHGLVDKVLVCERTAREGVPQDGLSALEERNGAYSIMPSLRFSKAYDECLGTMVWDRWESAIAFLGSLWLTAWVNAGEPDLSGLFSGETGQPDPEVSSQTLPNDAECRDR